MYIIKKRFEVSASHTLWLDYHSPCKRPHGHNWIIEIWCKSSSLNRYGMVIDFSEIKSKIHDVMDHQHLNDIFLFNPTAENIAKWICDTVPCCFKVMVQETENNVAWYEK